MTWTVSDVMTEGTAAVGQAAELVGSAVVTTTASTSLANAASLMFQHRVQLLPVVDSENRAVGIVSRKQLLKVFLRSDELIRREIVRIVQQAAAVRGHLEVEVMDGLVSLRGNFDAESLPRPLIETIAGVPGVVGVSSVSEPPSEASEDPVPA
jgi:CBS-domain-containing membrane protein